MARARRIKGLRPKGKLQTNARRIIRVRLDELLARRQALGETTEVDTFHAMRIAAKRLRYALEMFESCFPQVDAALQQLGDLQDALGSIHDLDVLIDLLRQWLRDADLVTEQQVLVVMESNLDRAEKNSRLEQLLYGQMRSSRLGLLALLGEKEVERKRQYADFARRWNEGKLDDLANQIEQAVDVGLEAPSEVPAAPTSDG